MVELKAKIEGVQRIVKKDKGTYAEVIIKVPERGLVLLRVWSNNGFDPKVGDTITLEAPFNALWTVKD